MRPANLPSPAGHGRPAPLSWLPGFYFLLYLRLGQQARFGPEAGFLTGKARPLGADGSQEGACAALAAALRLEGPAPHPFADPAELRRRVEGLLERRLDPELSALDRLIADPAGWMKRPLDTLLRLPDLYATRAPELVTALRTARDAEHVIASGLLAHLISVLPDSAFIGIGDDLLEVLNSKLLAGRRPLSEAEQAQSPRPFVGHRLLVRAPRLYLRLAELGERARPFLRGLAKVFPEAQTLQEALAKLDQDSSTLSE